MLQNHCDFEYHRGHVQLAVNVPFLFCFSGAVIYTLVLRNHYFNCLLFTTSLECLDGQPFIANSGRIL